MTKREALAAVAAQVAALADVDDVTSAIDGAETDADQDRLEWARGEVIRRLYRMGAQS